MNLFIFAFRFACHCPRALATKLTAPECQMAILVAILLWMRSTPYTSIIYLYIFYTLPVGIHLHFATNLATAEQSIVPHSRCEECMCVHHVHLFIFLCIVNGRPTKINAANNLTIFCIVRVSIARAHTDSAQSVAQKCCLGLFSELSCEHYEC